MLNVISRVAAGVLRGTKPSLTPQKVQNEGAKIVSAFSVNSEFINSQSDTYFLLQKFAFL
jgi:hypothetical protein